VVAWVREVLLEVWSCRPLCSESVVGVCARDEIGDDDV